MHATYILCTYIHLYTCYLMHCICINYIVYVIYIYIAFTVVIDRKHLLNPADLTGHASRGTKNSRTDGSGKCESHTNARSSTGSEWESVSVCGGVPFRFKGVIFSDSSI